jgi:hypothetical protein
MKPEEKHGMKDREKKINTRLKKMNGKGQGVKW